MTVQASGSRTTAAGGLILALAVLAIDLCTDLNTTVSVAYSFALLLACWRQPAGVISAATLIILALIGASYVIVHGISLDVDCLFRIVAAAVAVVLAWAFLRNRRGLLTAREELETSQADLKIVTDSVPQILWRAFPDGSARFVNNRFVEMTGVALEPMMHANAWHETFHPDDVVPFFAEWARVRETGEDFRAHYRQRFADGSYHWMLVIGRPELSDTGEIVGWYGGSSDVDVEFRALETIRELNQTLEQRVEKRTAELVRSEKRFRTLFENTNVAVVEFDISGVKRLVDLARSSGVTDLQAYLAQEPQFLEECEEEIRIIAVNDTFVRILGYSSQSEAISAAKGTITKELLTRQLDAIFYGQQRVEGATIWWGSGARRISVVFGLYLADEEASLCSAVDVSERDRAHQLMLAAREEMARANRAATVGALSVALVHELSQPTSSNTIDALTCLRLLDYDQPDLGQIRRIIERFARNNDRIGTIIKRTRDQVANSRRALRPTDLCQLVLDVRVLLEPELESRRAALLVRCLSPITLVRADPIELQQVVINLVMNALDAMKGQPGERIVRIEIAFVEPDRIRVSVSDHGPGIAQETQPLLFEPFFTTKSGGIGFGLTICRSIIEALGGQLSARNEEGGGAVFEFVLPLGGDDTADVVCSTPRATR